MLNLSGSELLLWGGIGIMAASVCLAVICTAVFFVTGRKT